MMMRRRRRRRMVMVMNHLQVDDEASSPGLQSLQEGEGGKPRTGCSSIK
jgi:hypothetical protein